jgi:hypothetical protein
VPKRPHPDPRYYTCSESNCGGRMSVLGYEPIGKKQAVYECMKCGRKRGEASLLTAYHQLRMRD